MSRLTNQIRQSMLNTMLDHAFSEKQAAAKAELIAAGDALYMDHHGEHLRTMQKLPQGFLYRSSQMDTNIGGQRHAVMLSEVKCMSLASRDSRIVFVASNPVAIEYLSANNKFDDLIKQRADMSREVNAVLESVHTFKKLWEVWPESKSLLGKFEEKPAIAILPAVQVNRLNASLGLPVSDLKEAV
ncbi:Nmad5 family putative nucleotide modification protein [Acinetobacter chinensis]|uniref:Nmad5 family putative nucleotide modification protein n=1 Tax=Acinetobacter chinensis TaxID=2004650 RepID=UPI002934569F|nr:Nmad5 family putative nucleotide modification protein [Acinetobacter chinensis]WOE40740.1 Nmad5 family putative nucleotide modification protein [Acinetobacter chinensis]